MGGGADWILGLALAIGATLAGSVGKIYMKQYHYSHKKTYLILGILCVIVLTPALSMGAISLAPQSLVSHVAALAIVWNTLLASRFLNEPVFNRDYVAAIILVSGSVLVTLGGPRRTQDFSREELNSFFTDEAFITYITLLGAWLVTLYMVLFSGIKCWPSERGEVDEERETQGVILIPHTLTGKVHRFAYAALAGTLAGCQFLFKAAVEASKLEDAWSHYETYIFGFASLIFTAIASLFHLNQGLRHYDAITVVSVNEAFLVFNGSISGLVVFHEFNDMAGSPGRLVMYFGGLAICTVGIGMFGTRGHHAPEYIQEARMLEQQRARERTITIEITAAATTAPADDKQQLV